MIPILLWHCPFCSTNDALVEKRRLFRPLKILCKACGTTWLERREVGVDSWLRVIKSSAYPDQVGVELKSGEWYAQMKAGVRLSPIKEPIIQLDDGELLYLVSRKAELTATGDNPHFFKPELDAADDELRKTSRKVGEGRVLLTNQRLIWEGDNGHHVTLWLTKLNSVSTLRNKDLILLYEIHMLSLRFSEESLLKWVTYFSKVAEEVQQNTGHKITTSHF